jgi:AsmA family protein
LFRRFLIIQALVAIFLVAAGVGAFFFVKNGDFGSFVAQRIGEKLGRKVEITSLRISPGRWIGVELRDVTLANLESGSHADMLSLRNLQAEIDSWSLLFAATPLVRSLVVEGVTLRLEKTHGHKNWHFGERSPAPSGGSPPDYRGVPTILDFQMKDSEIIIRTTSGSFLRTRIDQAHVTSEADNTPVRMNVRGSYNGLAATLTGDLDSFDALRRAPQPFPVRLHLNSGHTSMDFQGTMTDPLNFEGVAGDLRLHAPTPDVFGALAGEAINLNLDIELTGKFEHANNDWKLSDISGKINHEAFKGAILHLVEGDHGKPDNIRVDLAFTRLNLNRIIAGTPSPGGAEKYADIALALDPKQDPVIDARFTVQELTYAKIRVTNSHFAGVLAANKVDVSELSLSAFGAQITAQAHAQAIQTGTRITADVAMHNADIDALGRGFGVTAMPLNGRINGRLAVSAEGRTVNTAAHQARVSAVLSMLGGSVEKRVIELGSTDLRAAFRRADGNAPLNCLLGVLDMRAGVGQIAPLRIRAATGTIAGSGRFDINNHTMDLLVGSQEDTTSSFALDVPVRIHGRFDDPDLAPARWSSQGRAQMAAADNIAPLPPALRSFANQNPCLRRTGPPARH